MKKALFVVLCMTAIAHLGLAQNILWMGGEDVDFTPVPLIDTRATDFRAGYARYGLYSPFNVPVVSFGGALILGLGNTTSNAGLWVGADSTNGTKFALWKDDGTIKTKLAIEVGNSLLNNVLVKVDMQVISYGATATVNVYLNGGATAIISFTGDVTLDGNTNLNQVLLRARGGEASPVSEIIVADGDTRALSLVTLVQRLW